MAVAVKSSPQTVARSVPVRFLTGVGVGTVYVLGGLGLVFYGVPAAFTSVFGAGPIAISLLIVVMVATALGLMALAPRVLGPQVMPGMRSGIFFGIAEAILVLLVACGVGSILEQRVFTDGNATAGAAVTAALGLVLLALAGFLQTRPGYEKWMVLIEEQGWFNAAPYKRSQGQRVRRGTILGILILAGCGVYTLMQHKTLVTGAPNWQVNLPFAGGRHLVLLPDVAITLPLLLTGLSLWVAYRIVHLPIFADFLIATEAEMNKVSWTTRKKLIQDTIVVMVTVILLTVFLFVVDQIWGWALTRVGVLQITPADTQGNVSKEQPW